MGITAKEEEKKNIIQLKKPLAYEKFQEHPEKIKRKESVALIQLQYDYGCNFKCCHCAITQFKQNKSTLTIADVKQIADQADKIGLASICISGGEPLIFPDLKNIVKAINPDRFVISMDTNGWLLTEDKVKWLVDIGIDRIHLSIDGFKENHDEFRNKRGSWNRCIQALSYCKKYGLTVVINIVGTKKLVETGELLKQVEYLEQFNEHISIIFAKPVGAFEHYKNEVLDSKDIQYVQNLTKLYNCSTHLSSNFGHEFGCMCFKRHFSITAYGDVLPCPWIPIEFGNIHDEDLEIIVKRGLDNKWFSYDNKWTCLSGNRDSKFYQEIIPQIKSCKTYPANWREIQW